MGRNGTGAAPPEGGGREGGAEEEAEAAEAQGLGRAFVLGREPEIVLFVVPLLLLLLLASVAPLGEEVCV